MVEAKQITPSNITMDKFNSIYIRGWKRKFQNDKKDGLVVKFNGTGNYLNKTNTGNASGNEEIQNQFQSEFGEIVAIYAENQNIGTKTDYLTLAMNSGLFICQRSNGSFGFNKEEPYDICRCRR